MNYIFSYHIVLSHKVSHSFFERRATPWVKTNMDNKEDRFASKMSYNQLIIHINKIMRSEEKRSPNIKMKKLNVENEIYKIARERSENTLLSKEKKNKI